MERQQQEGPVSSDGSVRNAAKPGKPGLRNARRRRLSLAGKRHLTAARSMGRRRRRRPFAAHRLRSEVDPDLESAPARC